MKIFVAPGLVLGLVCLVLSGCGGGPPAKPEGVRVSGKVLLPNSQPLSGGTLILRPEEGLYGAIAQIQSDGTFVLADAEREKVIPGAYQIFVRVSDPAHKALRAAVPQRYQESSEDVDSDVIVTIGEETENLVIQLKR